jgi:RecA/RadA recombinase
MKKTSKSNGINDLVPEEKTSGKEEKKQLSIDQLKKLINKKAGQTVVYDLSEEENPSEVEEFISTGCRVLDSIICRGKPGGIPQKRVSVLGGTESCLTEDTLVKVEIDSNTTTKVEFSEIKQLLSEGKKVKIKSLNGEFVEVTKYIEKGMLPAFEIRLSNDFRLKCTSDHMVFANSGWVDLRNIVCGKTKLLCEDGEYYQVEEVSPIGLQKIVDISVDDKNQCFFGNGILNHNSGKSYLAGIIAKNAQEKGLTVVYFDSESSIDPSFLARMGCKVKDIIYIHATTVEETMETIETFLENGKNFLFVIDSITMLPCKSEVDGNFDPSTQMAIKPRVLSRAFSKLIQPLALANSTMLVCAQLKTNISSNKFDMMAEPYFMPSGSSLRFASSLSIWLTPRRLAASRVKDKNGFIIGTEVKASIKKSRFGTQFRECSFKILWGGDRIAVDETEAWFDIVKESDLVEKRGYNYVLTTDQGEMSCTVATFEGMLATPSFKKKVLEIVDDFLITRFDKRSGNAEMYYNAEPEEISGEEEEN